MAGVTLARDAGFRAKAALAYPGHDQLTLELGQAAEHSKHQPAMGRRGIGPSILEALEAGAAIADGSQNVEGRSVLAPLIFSLKTLAQPAAISSAS